VAGVAQVPRSVPAAIARTIPIGRKRLVGVSKPPHWIHLLGGPEAAHLIWAMRYRCRRRAGRRSWLVNYGGHRCTTRINWDGLASRPRHTTEQKQPADLPRIIAPWNKAVRAHHESRFKVGCPAVHLRRSSGNVRFYRPDKPRSGATRRASGFTNSFCDVIKSHHAHFDHVDDFLAGRNGTDDNGRVALSQRAFGDHFGQSQFNRFLRVLVVEGEHERFYRPI